MKELGACFMDVQKLGRIWFKLIQSDNGLVLACDTEGLAWALSIPEGMGNQIIKRIENGH